MVVYYQLYRIQQKPETPFQIATVVNVDSNEFKRAYLMITEGLRETLALGMCLYNTLFL